MARIAHNLAQEKLEAAEAERLLSQERSRRKRCGKRFTAPPSSDMGEQSPHSDKTQHAGSQDMEKRWHDFEENVSKGVCNVCLASVPFPSRNSVQNIATQAGRHKKKLFRSLALRWHPDKFLQRFGGSIVEGEREVVMAKVTETFQLIADQSDR